MRDRKLAGILRICFVVLALLLQLALIFVMLQFLRQQSVFFYGVIEFVSLITIFALAGANQNSSYTIMWMLVIAVLPVFGYLLYAMWGRSDGQSSFQRGVRESMAYGRQFVERDPAASALLFGAHPDKRQITGYLERMGFPVYRNTDCAYYPLGELQFDAMIADMEKAETFIFLCYFILDTGRLWDRISDVLTRKAAQGVEVRLMYDDLGSITTVPDRFLKNLRKRGIQVVRFGPVHKFIPRLYINYRDHQKIAVVDGNVGYTGGTNLADEYANYYPKHGHWKDTAIRMEGAAVWGLTATFLQMWDAQVRTRSDYRLYKPTAYPEGAGFFQPFADGPSNNPDNPAETTYRSMVANARRYLYITSPYLIIDNTMRDLLRTAAGAGVDVRIITPKIYDHWYVHAVTRSNYRRLLEAGVRIYEYAPGYIHAKSVVSDDEHCVIGSVNMDYRSFNLHYENGVWICGSPVVMKLRRDLEETFGVSEEIVLEDWLRRPWHMRLLGGVLRVFAVLM